MIFNLASCSQLFSQENISEEVEIYYNINEDNKTSFIYALTLSAKPNFTTAISKYTLSFPFGELEFLSIKSGDKTVRYHQESNEGITQLVLDLENKILNPNNPIEIEIKGNVKNLLLKETENSRILILPGNMSTVAINKLEISYPKSMGEITNFNNEWVVQHYQDSINLKTFNAGKVVNLVWGEKIAYSFEINKTLINMADEPTKTFDLNVPKSHGNQKVLFSKIEPTPNFAYQDAEGNLFFSYEVEPDSEININIVGQIEIDFKEKLENSFNFFERPILTETTGYWLLSNEYELNRLKVFLAREGVKKDKIDDMDAEEKAVFYKFAYKYVVERLELGEVRSTSMESYIRQGANNAVNNLTAAASEDYVDLLTAIYRHYGVPTRMLEGYVLMLNQGFYHSWIEFWDEENGWKSVDPALEDYSKGELFETQLFNHTIILSRGYNYIRPRMMFFDSKDFKVDFAESIANENISVVNSVKINPIKNTEKSVMGVLEIKNIGNTIISMKDFTGQEGISFGNHNALQIVVPGQTIQIPFIYEAASFKNNSQILLEYQSVNGAELLNPVNIDLQEQSFWWWNPLIQIIKYTCIVIIVYILYLISSRIFKWIEKYYQ